MESDRVRNIETVIEDVPLSSWVVDSDEEAFLDGKLVVFFDPADVKIERNVTPMEPETMARMVAAQELRKAVGGRKGVFSYLFYKLRPGKHPLVALAVKEERLQVEVRKSSIPPVSSSCF